MEWAGVYGSHVRLRYNIKSMNQTNSCIRLAVSEIIFLCTKPGNEDYIGEPVPQMKDVYGVADHKNRGAIIY